MINGFETLRTRCVEGITANAERCKIEVHNSIGVVTALNPIIGYEKAAAIAKKAYKDGRAVIDVAQEETDSGIFEDRKEKLHNFINQLPEQQQKIFTLHKLENLSYKEIASITDLSEKTIANHIYLASKFIRKKIENH